MIPPMLDCPLAIPLINASTLNLLHHYTSATGLLGIAKDRGFWATHSAFLNDSSESNHYVALARECIEINMQKSNLPEDERILLEILVRNNPLRYYSDLLPNGSNVFTVSFSEQGDQLSQWRAYCREGGYSVGYSLSYLRAVASAQGFYIGRCEYDPAAKQRIVESLIKSALGKYREDLSVNGNKASTSFSGNSAEARVLQLFHRSLHYYGPLLKHESFEEEQEWRAVIGPLPTATAYGYSEEMISDTWKVLKFRGGASVVIPYCLFYFEHESVPPEGAHSVIAGPSRMKKRGEHIIRALVRNKFGANVSYKVSSTPFEPL
jgi:hypothetical protein